MTEYVQFEPDGLFHFAYGEQGEGLERLPVDSDYVMSLLSQPVRIQRGVTLRDIFRSVGALPNLVAMVSWYVGSADIEAFHAEAEKPFRPSADRPLQYLGIEWWCELHEYNEIHDEERLLTAGRKPECRITTSFHGVGPPQPDDEPHLCSMRDNGLTLYSLAFSPMWEIAELPVRLDTSFRLYEVDSEEGEPKLLADAQREFTLLDTLDSIYSEITIHRSPSDKTQFGERVQGLGDQYQ